MFKFFRKQNSSLPEAEYSTNKQEEHVPVVNPISIDFAIELGGGKGWPDNVTCVLYHQHLGFLCAGTESGSIYIFGNGFQYLRRRPFDDDVKVKFMNAIYPDQLLVTYNDNSLVCFDIPKLNVICQILPHQWLNSSMGDIVTVNVDEPGLRPFIYVSTTDGSLEVLELNSNNIRICDYTINLSKAGQTSISILTSIQVCPKDEKYIALGYECLENGTGSVVIFDLVKQKIFRQYSLNAITSLSWTHTGELLFAGSRNGDIYCLYLEKQTCVSVFHSNSSKSNNDDESILIPVKQISWLPPQGNMGSGCLFVLLDRKSNTGESLEHLIKECMLALAFKGKSGEMELVFSLPPQLTWFIESFSFVPISPFKPYNAFLNIKGASAPSPTRNSDEDIDHATPGLLFVTQKSNHHRSKRNAHIMQLPNKPLTDWALEIGTLPAPREVWSMKCGSGNVTTINASKPTTLQHSFVGVLIGNYKSIAHNISAQTSEQLNAPHLKSSLELSDYVTRHRMHDGDEEEEEETEEHDVAHDLVLPLGDSDLEISTNRPCDVAFLGQDDGYVVCWGVTRPSDTAVVGRNNVWQPLLCLKNGYNSITSIAYDDHAGILVVSDSSGKICIWEVYEQQTGVGYVQYQKALLIPEESQILNSEPSADKPHIDRILSYKPNGIRYYSSFDLKFASISIIKILFEYLLVVIGTNSGDLYTLALYDDKAVPIPVNLSSFPIKEPLTGICSSYYLRQDTLEIVPALYVSFESNIVIVIHPITHEILSYSCSLPDEQKKGLSKLNEDSEDYISNHSHNSEDFNSSVKFQSSATAFACVLDSNDNEFIPSELISPSQVISANPRPSPEREKAAPKRQSVLTLFARNQEPPIAPTAIQRKSSIQEDAQVPLFPQTLIVLVDRRLLSYDIQKFLIPKKTGSNQLITATTQAITAKTISTSLIISGNIVSFIEEATRAWSEPLPSLLVANCEGGVFALRLKDKSSVGYVNLFEGVLVNPIKFSSGVVLQNGVCYFSHRNKTIYSARASSTTHILSQPLPTRAIVSSYVPTSSQLVTGREKQPGQGKKKKLISLVSSPTDLDKVFAKTKEQRLKEDLFSNERERKNSAIESDEVMIKTKQTIQSTAASMAEARLALEERGEKLNQLNKQSDELKYAAKDFQENAKAAKEIMKQKNSRWGLF